MSTLPERLREACDGHPHAKIPWPHRLLHEAAERVETLERQLVDMDRRLATSQDQTSQAIANTDRAIQQTADAIEQAQRYLKMYQDGVKSDAAGSGEAK